MNIKPGVSDSYTRRMKYATHHLSGSYLEIIMYLVYKRQITAAYNEKSLLEEFIGG